ncbi:MAG: sulfurtransferase [Microbacteriaceae bacterium]|nr:sulfurtransferase [Microbacteriaceae bacterium]
MIPSPFISAAELADLLAGPADARPVVFDASYLLAKPDYDGDYRSGSALEQWRGAHIPSSIYVDIQKQFSDPTGATHYTHLHVEALAAELARLGVHQLTPVVVYDTTQTMFAARLWYLLDWIGMNVRVLNGGLAAWQAAGHPVESAIEAMPIPAASWTPTATRNAWISKEELVARSADDSRPLVCGLPAGSFTGSEVTRYARRGHIPGSVNVSSRGLFAPEGTVLADAELRAAYVAEGVLAPDGNSLASEVLLYCGGGISATANALTLAAVGVTAVRVFDGSLEEWAADSSLPLETS